METGEVVRLVVGTIVIIAAAYYCTYWLANRKLRKIAGRGMRVRERFSLSKDKLLCTVEVQGKVYLIAFTNGGAALIDTYDAGEFALSEEAAAAPGMQYEPNGVVQKAIYALFNAARRTLSNRAPGKTSFSDTLEQSRKSAEDITLQTAKEENSIDELQNELNTRAAGGGSANGEAHRED